MIIRNLGVGAKWVKPIPYDVPFEMPNTNGIIVTMISANHCRSSSVFLFMRAHLIDWFHPYQGPGSSIFLFEGKRTVHAGDSPYPAKFVGSPRVWRYLHCGDFRYARSLVFLYLFNSSLSKVSRRACPKHILHPAVARGKLDEVYLDTTYLNPQVRSLPNLLQLSHCFHLLSKLAFHSTASRLSGLSLRASRSWRSRSSLGNFPSSLAR